MFTVNKRTRQLFGGVETLSGHINYPFGFNLLNLFLKFELTYMVITILGIDFPSAYAKTTLIFYQTWTKTDVFNDDIDRDLTNTINLSLILEGKTAGTMTTLFPCAYLNREPLIHSPNHSVNKISFRVRFHIVILYRCHCFFIYLFVFIVPSEKIKSKNKN